jgi:putative nucleotidyltransferase with HDIG domain
MFWNASTLISILAAVIYTGVFGIVISSQPLNRLRRIFILYLLAMISWSVSAFLSTSGIVPVLPWFKAMASSPIVMMLAIYFFVQTLFGLRPKLAGWMIAYGILAIGITLFSSIVVKDAYLVESGDLVYQLGTYFWIVAIPGYLLMILSVVELVRGYYNSLDANNRNRIRYLLLGLIITILATFVNFTEFGKYPVDVAANVVTAILIAYAILRHQLLDIRVVIRIGLLYSLTTAMFGVIYYVTISLALYFSQIVLGQEVFFISITVGALSAFLLSPLRSHIQVWIDRIFYREKFNAGLMLQRLSQMTASLLDLDRIANLILSEVMNAWHIKRGAIMIIQPESNTFRVIAEQGARNKVLTSFRSDHPVIKWIAQHNATLLKNDILLNPTFKSLWGEEKDELEKFQAELFIPLISKENFMGLMILGPKLSTQPYSNDDQVILSTLANHTAVAIENARLYEELEETFVQTISTLANAIDVRDTYTSSHSQRIADWAAAIARHLGCRSDEVRNIYWGGLLHDIGKIGIPDEILKKSGQLDEYEWELIKRHTLIGANLISPITKMAEVAPIIEYSHECYDGQGYPHGNKGEEIPLGARIIRVVDSFSAMRDDRPYKKAYSKKEAVEELKLNSGTMYDPEIVQAFLYLLETGQITMRS